MTDDDVVYVVTMYRYGNREKHSYVLGAWMDLDVAKAHASTEISWRGNKYLPEIIACNTDPSPDISEAQNVEMICILGSIT
jgi:hypothetical protein